MPKNMAWLRKCACGPPSQYLLISSVSLLCRHVPLHYPPLLFLPPSISPVPRPLRPFPGSPHSFAMATWLSEISRFCPRGKTCEPFLIKANSTRAEGHLYIWAVNLYLYYGLLESNVNGFGLLIHTVIRAILLICVLINEQFQELWPISRLFINFNCIKNSKIISGV